MCRRLFNLDQAGLNVALREQGARAVHVINIGKRPDAYPVPDPLVGDVGRLDDRFQARRARRAFMLSASAAA